jgi:hypothetical protein
LGELALKDFALDLLQSFPADCALIRRRSKI